jgi:ssDNA-binding Zn-finger/Zn-ribbon topoisomerase 1
MDPPFWEEASPLMAKDVHWCPRCRRAPLISRVNQLTGDTYYLCDNYPSCDYVGWPDELDDDLNGERAKG